MVEKRSDLTQRIIVLECLLEVWENEAFLSAVLSQALTKYDHLEPEKKNFIRQLADGCVRMQVRLDYAINTISKTKTDKMKPVIRAILRMGAYQLLYMPRIPSFSAVNESVALARKKGFAGLSGFVNGVLRNLDRKKDQIPWPKREEDLYEYLSIHYSVPKWLVSRIEGELPDEEKERLEDVLSALTKKRPLCMRLSRRMSQEEKDAFLASLSDRGIDIRPSEELAYAYFLEGVDGIESLPGYGKGKFYLQDIGSMLVTENAGIQPGDFVVDVCAAPGGKALHAAELLEGTGGHVLARDLSERRTERLKQNIRQSGLTDVEAGVFDATVRDENLIGKADVLIADLPCSGLGVMGRKSDIKYHISEEKIGELQILQRRILDTIWEYVKCGGILLYATCTMTRAENEENRDYILSHFPFELEKELRLTPGLTECDGFYLARFRRKEEA